MGRAVRMARRSVSLLRPRTMMPSHIEALSFGRMRLGRCLCTLLLPHSCHVLMRLLIHREAGRTCKRPIHTRNGTDEEYSFGSIGSGSVQKKSCCRASRALIRFAGSSSSSFDNRSRTRDPYLEVPPLDTRANHRGPPNITSQTAPQTSSDRRSSYEAFDIREVS